MSYDLIVCAVFKNEAHILAEWIQHYLERGVDHIYLVNDYSTDDYDAIIGQYKDKVTLFHNDVVSRDVGRQLVIYDKYFAPLLVRSKWMAILDLDEFLYSPTQEDIVTVLNNTGAAQVKVDWLHFGSNGHRLQPISAVAGFTRRAAFSTSDEFYSFKSIFQTRAVVSFGIHQHVVDGQTTHLRYSDVECSTALVINHYNTQSYDFYINVKGKRGDINNWYDAQKLSRDEARFVAYDRNEVEDLRLFEQNKGRSPHEASIGQTDEVTMVITSCNRAHLLDATLESFVKMNTYPIKLTYIIDDSGVVGCNDAVAAKYTGKLNIVPIYNPVNIGQVQSIDKVYSYVRTKWIFHCEEDWCFLKPGFIEKSMTVFRENPAENIFTVWLRPHTVSHPVVTDNLGRGYFEMKRDFSYVDKGVEYTWGGITFNPGLRKTTDCLLLHPYCLRCEKMTHNNMDYIGEYTVNKAYVQRGYYAMVLSDPTGHVDHIGWNDHIKREWD